MSRFAYRPRAAPEPESFDTVKRRETETAQKTAIGAKRRTQAVLFKVRRAQIADAEETRLRAAHLRAQRDLRETERLAHELRKLRDAETAELRAQQRAWQSPELGAFKSRLRAAYYNKVNDAQAREKQARKEAAKARGEAQFRRLSEGVGTFEEYRNAEAKALLEKKLLYRAELQDQMTLRETWRRFDYEQKLREKKMMDEIVERLDEEDRLEREEKRCKVLRVKREIEEFLKARSAWKQSDVDARRRNYTQTRIVAKGVAEN